MQCDWSRPLPIYRGPDFGQAVPSEVPFAHAAPQRRTLSAASCDGSRGCLCSEITIIPHVHGTHVESRAHVDNGVVPFPVGLNALLLAKVVSQPGDNLTELDGSVQLLILRKEQPQVRGFAGFGLDVLQAIRRTYPRVFILGTNEASFDPEQDAGRLAFHRAWFSTGTEFLVELLELGQVQPAYYYCSMNAVLWAGTDAIPASPILYPMTVAQTRSQ